MTEPSAKIILDSISPDGDRLTTMEVVCHRFMLAEFNTHRVFSRNSASSRAIPVKKQLGRVLNDLAYPLAWPKEQSGMQGGDDLDQAVIEEIKDLWEEARDSAVHTVMDLQKLGLHKSVANRLLEPFMWHTIVVSSTEWDNFFGLRCNPMAQPEIQAAAYAMRDALNQSTPVQTKPLQWHMPYIQPDEFVDYLTVDLKAISAARCARVSYLTQDGVRDYEKDIELYERLVSAEPSHASPLEHVATPWSQAYSKLGNFTGWKQLRHKVGK